MKLPLMRRDARLLRDHVIAAAAASVRPPDNERVAVYNPNLFHVGVIGSGIAVGYGVTSRWCALDGLCAAALSSSTGRGVAIVNWASHGATLDDQIREANMSNGFQHVKAVLWCPSYMQMSAHASPSAWRRRLEDLLEISTPSRRLVVAALPVPLGDDPAALTARPIIARLNAAIHQACEKYEGVTVAPVPPVNVRPIGQPLFDKLYYSEAAPAITALLLRAVEAEFARVPLRSYEPASLRN